MFKQTRSAIKELLWCWLGITVGMIVLLVTLLPLWIFIAVAFWLILPSEADAADDTYFYAEITQSITIKTDDWVGDNPTKTAIGHAWMWEHTYVRAEVSHMSNIDRGRPFNNRPESNLDVVSVTFGLRW